MAKPVIIAVRLVQKVAMRDKQYADAWRLDREGGNDVTGVIARV